MSSYTSWYKDGTASVVNGTTAVTGVDTYWSTAGIHAGDLLTFDDGLSFAEIASVNSDTSITLARPFTRGTIANATYAIIRNFTSGSLPEVASQVVDALGKYTRYFNEDIATLNGKSAYEVALEHGYSGTEAQWLESLKAANEWSTLNTRTNILTFNDSAAHNSYYRGKNLGTAITAAQFSAIRNGTFTDIYPGDYWNLPIDGTTTAYVVGCNVNHRLDAKNHVLLWLRNSNWNFSINDTDNVEGGFLNTKMYTEHFPYMLAKINEVIPDENIFPFLEDVSDSINSSGSVSHYTTIDNNFTNNTGLKIGLPSYTNIMGLPSSNLSYWIAGNNPDWPLFRLNPSMRSNMVHHWLNESSTVTSWASIGRDLRRYSFKASTTRFDRPTLACPYIHIG